MYVYASNRTEKLVEALTRVVAEPLASPFDRECIVVQGAGMERWLQAELARHFGVWANGDFPFPRKIIQRALTSLNGQARIEEAPFESRTLLWSIAALLPSLVDRREFRELQAYLQNDSTQSKLLQLSAKIARVFDDYVVYRPDLLLSWEAGKGSGFQPFLWRRLVEHHGPTHLASQARDFVDCLQRGDRLRAFPTRISVFGISSLPPLYLSIFDAIASQVDVHLFLLNPSREYWAETRSRRELLRKMSSSGGSDVHESWEDLDLLEGHPLLSSLGRVGREFQFLFEDQVIYQEPLGDLFEDPGDTSLLSCLQSDILHLRSFREGADLATRHCINSTDLSVRVHSCHSPMREVEVLHDQLRELFENCPHLVPQDVLVMTPSIETYLPFIQAVFSRGGASHDRTVKIPFRIADRRLRKSNQVFDALVRILRVVQGRMTATAVLDLLHVDVIRERFSILQVELERIEKWVAESQIRWGLDAQQRVDAGQPNSSQQTWDFGLRRIILGYAMNGGGRRGYGGTMPYDEVEGSDAHLLGPFFEFFDVIARNAGDVKRPRSMAEWTQWLNELLSEMITDDPATVAELQSLQEAIDTLSQRSTVAGFDYLVGVGDIMRQLEVEWDIASPGPAFLSGGVTFCEMVPMRTIPAAVICLLGMNGEDFPRRQRPVSFDLIAQKGRLGDRRVRDDDRYLFLEILLSARERLIISYVGQSSRDNSELIPSVVVSELLDHIEDAFVANDEEDIPDPVKCAPVSAAGEGLQGDLFESVAGFRPVEKAGAPPPILIQHPLQGFSPRYFDGSAPELFSYSTVNCEGALSRRGESKRPPPFFSALLPRGDREELLELSEVINFFRHPVRYFLRNRLSLFLDERESQLDDEENLGESYLDQWGIGDKILTRVRSGQSYDAAFAQMAASGSLPPGELGRMSFDRARAVVEQLVELALPHGSSESRFHDLRLAVGESNLVGRIDELNDRSRVVLQFSRVGGKSEMSVWLNHLVMNAAASALELPCETILIGRANKGSGAASIRFRAAPEALDILHGLLEVFREGIDRPVPFFIESGREFVECLEKRRSVDQALESARKIYRRDQPYSGEALDPYIDQIFSALDPFDPGQRWFDDRPLATEFQSVSRRIFEPLLRHRESLS